MALVAQLMLAHFCHLDLARVEEVQQMRLRGELMDLVNGPPRIDHLDRPDIADNVDLVRDSLLATTRSLDGVLQLVGLLLQMTVTIVLLVMVSPLFAVLPLCAVAPVLLERTAQSTVEGARERTAERLRLAKHLLELATSTGPVRELRLFGAEDEILRRQRGAWDEVTTAMWRAQLKAAVYRAAGQGFFALGYGGAIAAELYRALHGHASAGDLVLVITLAVQVSVQVSGALGVLTLLQVAGRTTDRIGDLRAVAAAPASAGAALADAADPAGVPGELTRGITLEDVSFTYPGAERPVLSGVSMDIPAGSVPGPGRRERGGQVHPGQAAVRPLPADQRTDPHRRAGPGRARPRPLALPRGHLVPGLPPHRADPQREHRARRHRLRRRHRGGQRHRGQGPRGPGAPARSPAD